MVSGETSSPPSIVEDSVVRIIESEKKDVESNDLVSSSNSMEVDGVTGLSATSSGPSMDEDCRREKGGKQKEPSMDDLMDSPSTEGTPEAVSNSMVVDEPVTAIEGSEPTMDVERNQASPDFVDPNAGSSEKRPTPVPVSGWQASRISGRRGPRRDINYIPENLPNAVPIQARRGVKMDIDDDDDDDDDDDVSEFQTTPKTSRNNLDSDLPTGLAAPFELRRSNRNAKNKGPLNFATPRKSNNSKRKLPQKRASDSIDLSIKRLNDI